MYLYQNISYFIIFVVKEIIYIYYIIYTNLYHEAIKQLKQPCQLSQ